MVPLLMALPIGPMLAWKRGDLAGVMQRLAFAVLAAIVAIVAVFAVDHRGPWLAPFGIALGVYVMAGAAIEWANRIKLGNVSYASRSIRRATNLPRSSYGTFLRPLRHRHAGRRHRRDERLSRRAYPGDEARTKASRSPATT